MDKITLTKEQRVLNVINRKPVDYLPNQISIGDIVKKEKLAEIMGFPSVEKLEDYLENHIKSSFTADFLPIIYRNDPKRLKELEDDGWCRVERENNILYDIWGAGFHIVSDGLSPAYHPLDSEEKIKKFKPPEITEGLFAWMKKDLEENSGRYFLYPDLCSTLYERGYFLLGFENMLFQMAANPILVEGLLEKLTHYRIEVAKRVVALGFKSGMYGDDLGNQEGPMFSKDMFLRFLKPRMARIFKVFKDAGLPVIMHSCGNITEFLPDLIEIGLDVIQPVQPCMDLKYIKKEFGRDITFWGGIDTQELLPLGTPDDVRKMAADTIDTLGKGGGYIIAPSQSIMRDVPVENIRALVETIITERVNVLK